MRKAQIAGQIFIYITAIVVVGFIIVYGYSAISQFTKRGQEVEYITLKTGIENSVKAITSDYGSVKRPGIDVPGKYKMVCFVDKSVGSSAADSTAFCQEQSALSQYYQPIACSGWKTGRSNVFLIPDGSENFDVNVTLKIDNEGKPYQGQPFICLDVVNGKIKLQLEGKGDSVLVSEHS